jgi:predicted site-specific integrase-resolvase
MSEKQNDLQKANDIIRSISKQRNDLANQVALLEAAVVARDRLIGELLAKVKEQEIEPELPLVAKGTEAANGALN